MGTRITQLTAAAALDGTELMLLSQLSTTVVYTATTISAQASDNSINDASGQFVIEGFAVGDSAKTGGFTGSGANNKTVRVITALTATKMTFGGTDGDDIVDDAAGESVTITKWESRRATADEVAALASGTGDVVGPATAADGALARYDGTTGKLIKATPATIATADIDNDAVSNAKLANVATATIKGRTTSGTGDPEDMTAAQAAAIVQGDGLTADLVGFRGIPQNSQSAAYTLVAADAGKHILHPSDDANARTFTIPSNASVAFAVGTAVTFINQTSQVVSIAITSDTLTLANTTSTGTRSLAQNGVATAIKVASTSWIISGAGLT